MIIYYYSQHFIVLEYYIYIITSIFLRFIKVKAFLVKIISNQFHLKEFTTENQIQQQFLEIIFSTLSKHQQMLAKQTNKEYKKLSKHKKEQDLSTYSLKRPFINVFAPQKTGWIFKEKNNEKSIDLIKNQSKNHLDSQKIEIRKLNNQMKFQNLKQKQLPKTSSFRKNQVQTSELQAQSTKRTQIGKSSIEKKKKNSYLRAEGQNIKLHTQYYSPSITSKQQNNRQQIQKQKRNTKYMENKQQKKMEITFSLDSTEPQNQEKQIKNQYGISIRRDRYKQSQKLFQEKNQFINNFRKKIAQKEILEKQKLYRHYIRSQSRQHSLIQRAKIKSRMKIVLNEIYELKKQLKN